MITTRAIQLANEYKSTYGKYPTKLIVSDKTYENILKEIDEEKSIPIFGMKIIIRYGGDILGMSVE